MHSRYHVLPVRALAPRVGHVSPPPPPQPAVDFDSDAERVMTDLTAVAPVTVAPRTAIDDALDLMKRAGVRLLLVVSADRSLQGLIAAEDIQGEKPVRYQQETSTPRREIRVGDIMVPADQLEVLDLDEVRRARVGDLVATFKRYGRQHVLVAERRPAIGLGPDSDLICGVFSARQIGRQLGIELDNTGIAGTFAELERALMAGT